MGTFPTQNPCIHLHYGYKYSTLDRYVIRMPKIEKKLNKMLIGAILGTTILGI